MYVRTFSDSSKRRPGSRYAQASRATPFRDPLSFVVPVVRAIQVLQNMNPCCADCNAPGPDWASVNLGVVVRLRRRTTVVMSAVMYTCL